jgi:hypothetical protein
MAKIPRATHKVFGSAGSSDNFAEFGSLVAAAPVKTKDIATIQNLPAWTAGFQLSIYGANKDLLLEDLNSCIFEHSTQIGYIFQAGIPEWDAATEYDKGSLVQRTDGGGNATGQIYQSLIDLNVGNAPPAAASNGNWLWVNPPADIVGAAATLNTIPKVTNTAPANGVPGSVALSDSNISDDGNNIIIAKPLKFPDGSTQGTAAAPVTAQTVATGVRAVGIVYQNTSSKPIFVAVAVAMGIGSTMQAVSDNNAAPTQQVGYCGNNSNPSEYSTLFFIVLPGNYYKLISVAEASFSSWIEWS